MLRCRDVTRLHASDEIRSAPLMMRLGVRVHLMMCKHCRRYVRELARIGEAVRGLYRDAVDSPEQDDVIIRRVLRESGQPPG